MAAYKQYIPSKALSNLVECYWTCKAPPLAMAPLERLIPGGRVEMIFNFGNPMQFLMADDLLNGQAITDVHVMGQRSRVYYTRQNGAMNLLGIRFKHGGISAFTAMPAAFLLNQVIPAEDIIGSITRDLGSRLLEKNNDAERVYLLDKLLIQSAKDTTKAWAACNKTADSIRHSDSVSINALCNDNHSYYKKLEREFLKYIGYTPKTYYRIVRFNKAIRAMNVHKDSLTSICYDCCYYDQSHFIKDFRHFTGTAPKNFQKENNWIAGFLINHQPV